MGDITFLRLLILNNPAQHRYKMLAADQTHAANLRKGKRTKLERKLPKIFWKRRVGEGGNKQQDGNIKEKEKRRVWKI